MIETQFLLKSGAHYYEGNSLRCPGVAAAFTNAANIISTLSAGKLKVLLADTLTPTSYNFCLKVTDDSGYGYNEVIDNLSLVVCYI